MNMWRPEELAAAHYQPRLQQQMRAWASTKHTKGHRARMAQHRLAGHAARASQRPCHAKRCTALKTRVCLQGPFTVELRKQDAGLQPSCVLAHAHANRRAQPGAMRVNS